jgi:alpha-galactosidase
MLKISMIAAGAVAFTRKIVGDILSVPELQDTAFHFQDIDEERLEGITRVMHREIKENPVQTQAKIEATTDRREALKDADYVFNAARIGGMEGWRIHTDIPLKYGVDQAVADTLCPGGIMFGQMGIPFILDVCEDIADVAKPGVVFLNHGNPMAMLTWAALHYSDVNFLGLCHGVQGNHPLIAKAFGLPKEEVDFIAAGINHQTWFVRILHKGKDLTGDLLAALEAQPDVMLQQKCRVDVLRRTGYFSTEGNGHLSEYLPWYRKRADDIDNWIAYGEEVDNKPNFGETGGFLRKRLEDMETVEEEFARLMESRVRPFTREAASHEHGHRIIEALETGRPYRGEFNVINNGSISNLPDDAIVETPCYVDGSGIQVTQVGDLPDVCAAICNASIAVQRLSVKAAITGDAMLLKQAMMMDPLTAAVCSTPEIWQMTDELLVADAQWLPQYADAIAEARKNLATAEPLGTKGTAGYARIN